MHCLIYQLFKFINQEIYLININLHDGIIIAITNLDFFFLNVAQWTRYLSTTVIGRCTVGIPKTRRRKFNQPNAAVSSDLEIAFYTEYNN